MPAPLDTSVIRDALERGDYLTVIDEVRSAMTTSPVAAIQDPVIHYWLERRYRNLFVREAAASEHAVKNASPPFPLRAFDDRPDEVKVAMRYFRRMDPDEVGAEMPEAQVGTMSNTTLVFAPGMITGLLPSLGFQSVWPRIKQRFGIDIIAVDAHPMRSSEENVADILNTLDRGIGVAPDLNGSFVTADDDPKAPGDVIVIGYSKGSVDMLTTLVHHPDIAPRVKAFIGWAGAIGGSYAADDIYQKIRERREFDVVKDLHGKLGQLMRQLVPVIQVERVNRRIDEYDIKGSIQSVTTWNRQDFNTSNAAHFAELGVPMFYFSGAATPFEVPWFQRQESWVLSKRDPLNDMQVTQSQTRPPLEGAPHLAIFRANHWDLSYDTFPWYASMGSRHLKNPFPREAAMASLVLFMSEIGLLT